MYNTTQFKVEIEPNFRDVSSTARLFNFNRPVYISEQAWQDCIDSCKNKHIYSELAVLQRLRSILYTASHCLHGSLEEFECEFEIRDNLASCKRQHHHLRLLAERDENNHSVIRILHINE